jgi:cell division protein FtsI (penicillin-binding protein 3)
MEKIDPATRTYSHTKLVASFAGFAPVSTPAIAIAVVIDTPTAGGEAAHYGGAASAPVFAQVAQEVLEYLGVPRDQPLKTAKQIQMAKAEVPHEEVSNPEAGDLATMFDEVNSLPADDPLRQPAAAAAMAANQTADQAYDAVAAEKRSAAHPGILNSLPQEVMRAFHAAGNTTSVMPDSVVATNDRVEVPVVRPPVLTRGNGAVVVDGGKRVAVPEFHGAALRAVVEEAGHLGLRVQTMGSGLAQEQAPVAGTMVPVGTEIVVRFVR